MKSPLSRITGGEAAFPLVVLCGLNAVDELDRAAFNVLLPNIRRAFGLDLGGVLLLVAAIVPVTVLLSLPIAHYADRLNRTRMARFGACLWSGFSLCTGFAVNVIHVAFARIGSGIGKTVNDSTHNSLIADYYSVSVRPAVYSAYRSANSVGLFLGPLAAGFLALWFSWRVPFILFAFPTVVFILLSRRLKEPARGVQDRRALGVSEEKAVIEETPAAFSEAWSSLYAIASLRRIYVACPFLGASAFGLGAILSLFYEEVYKLDEAERGLVFAFNEPFQIAGLFIGAPIAQYLMKRDPALVLKILAVTAVGTAAGLFVIATSPNLAVALGGQYFGALVGAFLTPGILAVFSIVVPARIRAVGFVSGTLWFLPGLLILPILGEIGDTHGLRTSVMLLIPIYLTGAWTLASAGKFFPRDIEACRVGSMAEQEVRAALAEGEPKLLMARKIDVSYDSVQVLFGVNIELYDGEVIALLGTNGAGKSTLLKAIAGIVDPHGGSIYYDGNDVTHKNAKTCTELGIILMPGGRSVFPTLTVQEHLDLATWSVSDDQEHIDQATREVLDMFPRLEERLGQSAGNLSGGEQQMLGLGMAFISKPKILMIDELSLGLAPIVMEQLLESVRRINERGTAIILVEQSVNVALSVAERAYFLEKGEVRFSGTTADLAARNDIVRAVFLQGAASQETLTEGSEVNRTSAARRAKLDLETSKSETPVLSVRGMSRSFGGIQAVSDVSFDLAPREILGLIGPNGAGKTTMFDLVSGFLQPDTGTITFDTTDVTTWSPNRRALGGLGRSFQDARIFPSLSVRENIALSLERHLKVKSYLADALGAPQIHGQERMVRRRVDELIDLMNLGAYRDKFVSDLSTGSRRVVDLAMAIAYEPKVLILDEPSSGIAQSEAEALVPLLENLQVQLDCSLLVIEHDMPLITSISDRILALELGSVIAEGTPEEVTADSRVISSYLGGDFATINRSGPTESTVDLLDE